MDIPLSIVIPALNEAPMIKASLEALMPLRAAGCEVLVVDGGSQDDSVELASPLADRVLTSLPGRARQMNTGARAARGEILLFLHSDTELPPDADKLILERILPDDLGQSHGWGRFNVRLSGSHPLLRMVETMINIRSRLSGIATGDQAIFVRRDLFDKIGGFQPIPLMEDVALSRALGSHCPPLCLKERVITSSRRWEQRGIWRTIFLMWRLRWGHWRGEDPEELAKLW